MLVVIILAELAWLYCLIAHLRSSDIDPTDKVCWTVVLCALNILGLLLYVAIAPKRTDEAVLDSDERIKKAANEGRL